MALSCALIHKPRLLVLDEPTTGVDAVSRTEFWEMLGKLKAHNITVVVSTPYMDEATKCDRVALIQEGQILSVNPPEVLKDSFSRKLFYVKAPDKYNLLKILRSFPLTISAYPFGDSIHTTFSKDNPLGDLNEYLLSKGINDFSISEGRAGIEDRFLELMGTESIHYQ